MTNSHLPAPPRVAVVDYGAGNLRSIRRALEAAGAEVEVTSAPERIAGADAVVLPGVGAAGTAMDRLHEGHLIPVLHEAIASGKPFLGICLGMQLLFEDQEEGDTLGLGVLRGRVRSLPDTVKIPHMGWNRSRVVRPDVLGDDEGDLTYYFVHSFVVDASDPADIAAETTYGEAFPSIVVHDNIWGTQFHPEKSGDEGLALVKRFVDGIPVPARELSTTGVSA